MPTNLQVNNTTTLTTTGTADPVLSLLIPFEPKITARAKIEATIQRLVNEAEEKLHQQQLPAEQVEQIMMHLRILLGGIEYNNQKKSIALMVTPQGGRLYYWNMPVQEAITISNEFAVRELAAQKRVEKEYLLLAIGDHFGGIYLGNGARLSRLVANSPFHEGGRMPEPKDHISETERAVQHLDNALSILLRSYRHPVFVIGPRAYLQSFRDISRNSHQAAAFIEANPHGNDARLQQLLAPYLADWQGLTEKALVQQLELSLQKGKLAVGITEVWAAAFDKRGKTLVVESDYNFPAYLDQKAGVLYADTIPLNKEARKTTDAVAAIMEKVLADGGTVEIVRPGTLADYVHIALTCF